MGERIRIPLGDWAKDMLGDLFPQLTPEQIAALREGRPVPASPASPAGAEKLHVARPSSEHAVSVARNVLNTARQAAATSGGAGQCVLEPNWPTQAEFTAPTPPLAPEALPVVSCILVFADRSRIRFAQRAIKDFTAQLYPRKELVIVNATDLSIKDGENFEINEVMVLEGAMTAPTTIGELRNIGIDAARGDWVKLCWDDDDIHSPWLLVYQMLFRRPGAALALTSQLRVDLVNNSAIHHSAAVGIANTLIVPADKKKRFVGALERGEVARYWGQHYGVNTVAVPNAVPALSCLSIAVHHGNNLTPVEQFMAGHVGPSAQGIFRCAPEEIGLLSAALAGVGYKIQTADSETAEG